MGQAEVIDKGYWLRLDNSANLYPAIRSSHLPWVFRISATLKKRVHAGALQNALDTVIERFPYFKVRLRAGFFWYYLEQNPARLLVRAEGRYPCMPLPDEDGDGYLLRVTAREKRVAVEFFHALTDGSGALKFLQCLVTTYLESLGRRIDDWQTVLNPNEAPDPEESEDAFRRYLSDKVPKPARLSRAFRLPFPIREVFRYSYLCGECSAADVALRARAFNVSVTEYLAGVYLYVLQQIFLDLPQSTLKRYKKMLRLEIPVNLRNLYPSKSMRNFSLFVTPGIDMRLGEYKFEEIVKLVHHYMQTEVAARRLNQQISRNVKPELNAVVRALPLVAKNSILFFRYNAFGPTQYSGVLTNLGRVGMPGCIEQEIEAFTFIPSPGRELRVHGAVATYGDKMRITFGSMTDIRELERRYFRFLSSHGIQLKIRRYADI